MKKSQVLAAIALAFALGLAPIASTFAVTSIKDQCLDAEKEVKELIADFGDQTDVTNFETLKSAMDVLNDMYAPKAADLKAAYNAYETSGGTTTPATTARIYPVWYVVQLALNNGAKVNGSALTIDSFTGKNFDQVVALADSATYASFTQDQFDNVVETAEAAAQADVNAVLGALNTISADMRNNAPSTETMGSVLAYVNGLPGYTKTVALDKAYNAAGLTCTGTEEQVKKTVDAYTKAIADFKAGTTNNGDAGEAQKPTTPDTGANTASEESATASVSILSGVASVVTAAGVVIRKAFRK